ncbi:MAG: response regulator [Roseovarius sp.]
MLRVLSIEDDLIMQDMIAATLETKGGYKVEFADNGAQGLSMLTQGLRKFDCLLIDVNLPDMTGIEFTEKARALRGYDETPMIVVTKSDDEATIVDAFCAGATDFLAKPFIPSELIARLSVAQPQMCTKKASLPAPRRQTLPALPGLSGQAYRSGEVFLNFLHSLDPGQVRKTTLLAVDHMAARDMATSDSEPDGIIPAIVDALSRIFDKQLVICTSLTDHQVVAALSARPSETPLVLTHRLVEQIQASHRNAGGWTPGVIVGNPITPSMFFADEPLRLLERALLSVERRRRDLEAGRKEDNILRLPRRLARKGRIRTADDFA